MREGQTIRCEIESCAHCAPDHFCKLHSIRVCAGGLCEPGEVRRSRDCMCASFEQKIF